MPDKPSVSNCESCGAKVIFVKDQDGKRQILNKVRARVYDQRVEGEWEYLTHGPIVNEAPRLLHISHFLTCPNASTHSRRGSER